MPSDDLILAVRQIGNYPPTADSFPGDLVLIQRGGLGGPYQSITTQALVATALAQGGGPLDVSTGFAPADAVAPQIFTDNLVVALGATHNWNCYFSSTLNAFAYTTNGPAAAFGFDGTAGFLWNAGPFGSAGAEAPLTPLMQLSATGQLLLFSGSINLPRDPMAPNEAATAGWVAANTVASFNGRTGAVTLGTWDILYAGGAPIWSPEFGGAPKAPTPEPASCDNRIATTQYVQCAIVQSIDSFLGSEVFVASFNGRTGPVVLTAADVTALGLPYAPIDSPNFTGYATSLTPPQGTSTGQIATTAFVMHAVAASVTGVASWNGRTGLVVLSPSDLTGAGGALLGSPIFTGTPQAPTAAPGTNTNQIATCAFVEAQAGGNFAPLNSPAFTGVPTGPTAAVGTDTSQLATTAFVMSEINAVNAGVISFNGRTGVVTLLANDISAAGGATLNSPIFTGMPLAPTATPATNTTQIATTAFVTAAIAALPAVPVASTALPLINGPATAGTSAAFSRGDHVHPVDTSRAAATALASYLPLTGGTVSGGLTVAGAAGLSVTGPGGVTVSQNIQVNGQINVNSQVITPAINVINPGNPTIVLIGGASNILSQWYYDAASGYVAFNNVVTGANFTLDGGGNINVTCGGIGNLLLTNGLGFQNGGGPWASLSDARIKTVQGEYEVGLAELSALRPIVYVYKGNEAIDRHGLSVSRSAAQRGTQFVGLVAQEVEAVFPGMVGTREGYIDGQPVDDLRTLNTGPITYALVNAVKELAARVAALEGATA